MTSQRNQGRSGGKFPINRSALKQILDAVLCIAAFVPFPSAADIDYAVDRPVVTLSLEYQQKDESRSGPGVPLRREESDTFWQSLELQSRGWIYHPDLLLFSFGLEPQWKQQDTTATDPFTRDDSDNFLGSFLDAQVLRQKPHSFKLFLRQSRNEFNSTLSPDNITEIDVARAGWLINSDFLPTTVTFERNNTKFEDFSSTRDDSDIFRVESKYKSDKHQFNLLSEYVDQFRQIDVQEYNVDRYLLNINSNYAITDKVRLTSTIFNVDSESEISDSKNFLWSERLMWEHRPNLRSEYTARFDARENESFRSDARFLSGALEHHLYENLRSRLELYTSNDKFNDGEIDIREVDLDFRYLRAIPIGMLTITNGYAYRVEDNDIDAESSQVLGEPHRLVGTSPEVLVRSNIDINSVIVTDTSRLITYIEGIDYILNPVGDSVTIERRLFGGIADGETVLVDYVFATQAPFKKDRRSARFGANVNLWHSLRLYYNYNRIKEELISGTLPSDLSNDRIQRVGASFRWRWSRTTADYELRDTVRTPLSRLRFQQAFTFRVTPSFSFGASAGYSETDFRESGSDSRTIGLTGNLRWDMGRWGRFELSAFSRDIDGESQQTISNGLISKWSMRYGQWYGFVRFEELDESDDLIIQDRERSLVTLHVSRVFR